MHVSLLDRLPHTWVIVRTRFRQTDSWAEDIHTAMTPSTTVRQLRDAEVDPSPEPVGRRVSAEPAVVSTFVSATISTVAFSTRSSTFSKGLRGFVGRSFG